MGKAETFRTPEMCLTSDYITIEIFVRPWQRVIVFATRIVLNGKSFNLQYMFKTNLPKGLG